jgi:hypothetical protein
MAGEEKRARNDEDDDPVEGGELDGVSEAGREEARFVISTNACRFAAFSSERVTLFDPKLPNSMSRVHLSLGS